ncbi:MAG: RagB/SusD family nutrient uptake outer membrane protein [Paludibacteraceae bacterium]
MKKIKYSVYPLLIFVLLAGFSCTETSEGFLDAKEETETLRTIFSDSLKTMQFQASIYWKIPDVIMGPRNPGNGYYLQSFYDYDAATDNMKEKSSDRKSFAVAFSKGDFTQDGINANFNKFLNSWTAMYQNIRVCNQFLENCEMSPLSRAKKDKMIAETRYMRAFYYFHLMRNFGGIPLVGDKMLDPFEDQGIPRATFEVTVDFIANELETAANALPDEQNGNDYGRPTKGAALAMLAKLYLYAASPLYNGGNIGSGNNRLLMGYDDYQLNRWQKVKDALDNFFQYNTSHNNLFELIKSDTTNIIDANGDPAIKVVNGYYKATTSRVSKERIWFWIVFNGYRWPQGELLPASRTGKASVLPYHDLTEAFPTKDGVEIRTIVNGEYATSPGKYNENNTLYNPNNPYENRDPRFYIAFLYNEAKWAKAKGEAPQPVYTYRGAASDGIFTGSTSTGYYFVKLCKEGAVGNTDDGAFNGTGVAFIRYADMLLMDAEAMTELDYETNRIAIEDRLKTIRQRAGIEPGTNLRYGIPENMTKEQMIAFILNERRIEFVLESGNRYWDLKRRKLFEKLDKQWSHAAIWEKAGDNPDGSIIYSWSVQAVEQHFFDTRMYHFPIPLKEVEASHATLIQNEGW